MEQLAPIDLVQLGGRPDRERVAAAVEEEAEVERGVLLARAVADAVRLRVPVVPGSAPESYRLVFEGGRDPCVEAERLLRLRIIEIDQDEIAVARELRASTAAFGRPDALRLAVHL